MRVAGIDPGSQKMGYAVVDAAPGMRLTLVEAGVLSASPRLGKYDRLVELGRDLEDIVREFRPDAGALEAGFVRGQMGALVSGAARGVAAFILGSAGVRVVEYAPKTVKKFVTGSGDADKEQVARAVMLHLRLLRQPDPDAADAIGIAIVRAHDREAGWVERPRAAAM